METQVITKIIEESVKVAIPVFLQGAVYMARRAGGTSDANTDLNRTLGSILTPQMEKAIRHHMDEVVSWSAHLQFFGMAAPMATDHATIPLDIHTEPLRFQLADDSATTMSEEELSSLGTHVMLLGEPGAGKTTTLKRIAFKMLATGPISDDDTYQFPIVIRLRELNEEESLFDRIADVIGVRIISLSGQQTVLGDTEVLLKDNLKYVVVACLNKMEVLLLLDGLDELRQEHRVKIREEIVQLARGLTSARLIFSCRSGDYSKQMEGFSVCEIRPLSGEQIREIAKIWLPETFTEFLSQLERLPYSDIVDRPLLLTQLLFIFKRYGYFPDQPSEIYEKMVNLLLKDWDEQRDLTRGSDYAGFGSERKAKFLAALAYRLYYGLEKTRFQQRDIETVYQQICLGFNLPEGEGRLVAQEVQTHTGIITIGTTDAYEFCHLSLQEYLCAVHLVTGPVATLNVRHLAKFSPPLAIAVALSSNPSEWFASLILSYGNVTTFDETSMSSFLARLLVERPIFVTNSAMGLAILLLYQFCKKSSAICRYLDQLILMRSVNESITSALRWYDPKETQPFPEYFAVRLKRNISEVFTFPLPPEGLFPRKILPDLSTDNLIFRKDSAQQQYGGL